MDQHVLTRLHIGASYQHMPCRNRNQGQCRCLLPGEFLWLGNDVHSRGRNQAGISAISAVAENVIFRAEIIPTGKALVTMTTRESWVQHYLFPRLHPTHQLPNLSHDSCDIIAKYVRKPDFHTR